MALIKLSLLKEYSHFSVGLPREMHVLLRLEFNGPVNCTQRPPIHLALVLDRSGSMAGEKLELTKQAAIYFMNWLTRRDFLAVVVYDDNIEVMVPHQQLIHKISVADRIKTIQIGGSTNLSGGWMRGLSEIRDHMQTGHIHRVLLLTDGLANAGITEKDKLVEIAARNLQKGIATTTLGFGTDFDETMLKAIAEAGSGRFHYVSEPEGLAKAFQKEFGELSALLAQNLELHIETQAPAMLASMLTDYPHQGSTQSMNVRLGDVRAGDVKQLVFSIRLPDAVNPEHTTLPLARITARCDTLVENFDQENMVENLELPIASGPDVKVVPEPEVEREVWLARAIQFKLDAARKLEKGNNEEAIALLRGHVRAGEKLADKATAQLVREECKRLLSLAQDIESGQREAESSKNLVQSAYQQSTQSGAYHQAAGLRKICAEILARRPEDAQDVVTAVLKEAEAKQFEKERLLKIQSVLRELLDNALEHGCKGMPGGVVHVECHISENYVRMVVADDGPGFNYEDKIKEEKERKDAAEARGRGLLMISCFADRVDFQTKKGTRAEVVINRETLNIQAQPVVSAGTTEEVAKQLKAGVTVIKLEGPIEDTHVRQLEETISQAIASGYYKIILEMSSVNYINSTGLGLIVKYADRLQDLDGNIVILNISPRVRSIFETMGIAEIVPMCDGTVNSAMEFFT